MEFKVGDKVKILKHDRFPITGSFTYCDRVGSESGHKNAEGKIGFVKDISDSYITVRSRPDGEGEYFGLFASYELLKVRAGRPVKELPIKFVVFYDEDDHDPMKTFSTDKELKSWIKEAKDDEDIDFSSIRVFEVKKEFEVKLSTKVRLSVKK